MQMWTATVHVEAQTLCTQEIQPIYNFCGLIQLACNATAIGHRKYILMIVETVVPQAIIPTTLAAVQHRLLPTLTASSTTAFRDAVRFVMGAV